LTNHHVLHRWRAPHALTTVAGVGLMLARGIRGVDLDPESATTSCPHGPILPTAIPPSWITAAGAFSSRRFLESESARTSAQSISVCTPHPVTARMVRGVAAALGSVSRWVVWKNGGAVEIEIPPTVARIGAGQTLRSRDPIPGHRKSPPGQRYRLCLCLAF
jgi:hypothetical protein